MSDSEDLLQERFLKLQGKAKLVLQKLNFKSIGPDPVFEKLQEKYEKLDELQNLLSTRADEIKQEIEKKNEILFNLKESFREFRRGVALKSVYPRSKKKIPESIMDDIESCEREKDLDLKEVRVSSISLKNQHEHLLKLVKAKDQVTEDLKLTDFDQIRMENQDLSDQILKQTSQFRKIQKQQISFTIRIVHTTEKNRFLQSKCANLEKQVDELQQNLIIARDRLEEKNIEKENLQKEIKKLQNQHGSVSSDDLLKIFEEKEKNNLEMEKKLKTLKAQFQASKMC